MGTHSTLSVEGLLIFIRSLCISPPRGFYHGRRSHVTSTINQIGFHKSKTEANQNRTYEGKDPFGVKKSLSHFYERKTKVVLDLYKEE